MLSQDFEFLFGFFEFPGENYSNDSSDDNEDSQLAEVFPTWFDDRKDDILSNEKLQTECQVLSEIDSYFREVLLVRYGATNEMSRIADGTVENDENTNVSDGVASIKIFPFTSNTGTALRFAFEAGSNSR